MVYPPEAFSSYWQRMKLREQAMTIPARCIYWQPRTGFNQVEALIWERVRNSERILDFGSGDQSLRRKFISAGYQGRYETVDKSPEFETTWKDPDGISGQFGAVLCLEVIEHMSFEDGCSLRERLASWVAPGGWLILSTPNPRCVVSPFAADETHVHLYPLHDLLTWALSVGLQPEARRVKLLPERLSSMQRLRNLVQRVLCYFIGADRADGLLILARRAPVE